MIRTFSVFVALICGPLLGHAAESAPAFEITDVHPSARATNPYTFMSGGVLRGGRYDLRKATMLDLIATAWGVDADTVLGGPNWLELDRFDVAAKAPPSTPPETVKLMLQTLLTERFKVVLHKDTRPLPAFALTVGKGKPKMKEADGSANPGCEYQPQPGSTANALYSCRNITMDAFAQTLREMAGDYLTAPVVNSTGLQGAWDFDVKWNYRSGILQAGADRLTIFDAVDKQLGLMLKLETAPASVIVVDRVNEKPSPDPPGAEKLLPPRAAGFEVADLKPSRPDEPPLAKVYPGGRFEMRAFTMKILIANAFDIDWDHADELIAGLPKWTDSARFDINAKPPVDTFGPPGVAFTDDLRLMLRNLLIERFSIRTHYEDRLIPAYRLATVKPKMRKADPSHRSSCREARVIANDPRDTNPTLSRLVTCHNTTMAQFAEQLQRIAPGYIATPVEDATGISGAWDFTLSFSSAYLFQSGPSQPGEASSASEPNGAISLFNALNKQLGLKLEKRKLVLPILVIDHMDEKPTEN